MSKYILAHGTFVELTDEELMHWRYIKREKKNGKWRYYYPTKTNGSAQKLGGKKTTTRRFAGGGGSFKKNVMDNLDRYAEAAEVWINSFLSMKVSDTLKGKKSMSWQEAKEEVDRRYRYGDKAKMLTDKYRD